MDFQLQPFPSFLTMRRWQAAWRMKPRSAFAKQRQNLDTNPTTSRERCAIGAALRLGWSCSMCLTPYCAQIVMGIENGIYRFGSYLPIVVDVQKDRARFRRFFKMLLERQVEGVIVLGNATYPEGELLEPLKQHSGPWS